MKVLHINSYDKKGGAETIYRLTVDNLNYCENYTACVQLDSNYRNPDIPFRSWENYNRLLGTFNYIFSFHNYRLLNDFLSKNDVDIIHLHGFFASISPSILKAIKNYKKRKRVRVVQTLHDFHLVCPNSSLYNYSKGHICEKCVGKKYKLNILWNNCDRRGWAFSIIKGIRSFVANNILKHKIVIDLFISPSSFLRDMVIRDGIEESKVLLLRNPIIPLQESIENIKKENIICYFGRFSKEKNLGFLINAFEEWKKKSENDFKLLLIGDGEEKDKLTNLRANSANINDIIIKDFMPYDQLIKEIKTAKYFSMSSTWYENAPMSIIEAAMLGIIPIVPDLGGMAESINEVISAGKTYNQDDITSWIKAITFLESDHLNQLNRLLTVTNNYRQYYLASYISKSVALYKQHLQSH